MCMYNATSIIIAIPDEAKNLSLLKNKLKSKITAKETFTTPIIKKYPLVHKPQIPPKDHLHFPL